VRKFHREDLIMDITYGTITAENTPQETLDSLAVLSTYRGATVTPLGLTPEQLGDVATVWVVLADDQESGYGDMDNRVDIVGTFATLPVAVAHVWRQIVIGDRIFNPTFTQHVVQTVINPVVPRGWDSTATPHGLSSGWVDDDDSTELRGL
jgi:hypothetical protein